MKRQTEYINGTLWYDTDGNVIHAHGGFIINDGGYYYWYGENRTGENYVSCYRSKDLLNWEFRNNILTSSSEAVATRVNAQLNLRNDQGGKVNIERPKVLFNKKTKKYVMWAHYENGMNYHDARCCVASCDTPDGNFIYHGSFNPFGEMSRDCTLFLDDDERAYFISAGRQNLDTHVYRLSEDFLNIDKFCGRLWQSEMREAPAVFKKNGEYYMVNSYCTGWVANQGMYSRSKCIYEDWKDLLPFGDETTFTSQPSFVLPVNRSNGDVDYYYFGDRWCYKGLEIDIDQDDVLAYYNRSTYVVLKIEFDADCNPYIKWNDAFKPNIE